LLLTDIYSTPISNKSKSINVKAQRILLLNSFFLKKLKSTICEISGSRRHAVYVFSLPVNSCQPKPRNIPEEQGLYNFKYTHDVILLWSTTFTGRRWIWLRQQCKSIREFILSFRL